MLLALAVGRREAKIERGGCVRKVLKKTDDDDDDEKEWAARQAHGLHSVTVTAQNVHWRQNFYFSSSCARC